ncbi:hypothetical protein AFERRI_30152 [Acidithiobacillus ferrivorans]|uniref:Uncharacterized protein n=1 Tax=Acidithiobacillus ferrivorans TaxID=160808 RepID=A0A060UMJ4_9PROT|nr:hypothetical protein AFERRI_30152 [Acidithiobacillus ferrivorans]
MPTCARTFEFCEKKIGLSLGVDFKA